MESIKSFYNNLSDMSKTLIKMLFGIACALLALFILVLFIRLIRGSRQSYTTFETTVQRAATKYYKKNSGQLPSSGSEAQVSIDTLVSDGYLKEVTKYLGKDTTCSGEVYVINNSGKYAYIPNLDCGEKYKSKVLVDAIIENNNLVEEGAGLYLEDDMSYVFRGEYVNNYMTFANLDWRIIKINEDGSIRALLASNIKKYRRSRWDNRYNVDKKSNVGINDYEVSRIRETLDKIYADESVFNDNQKALIVPQNLCVGSRAKDSNDFSGTEECAMTVDDQYLGLLQVNEFLYPSIDENCNSTLSQSCLNYNYLTSIKEQYWTLTPYDGDTYQVYRVSTGLHLSKASGSANVLFTIHLSDKTQIKEGTGTSTDPFKVNDYSVASDDTEK